MLFWSLPLALSHRKAWYDSFSYLRCLVGVTIYSVLGWADLYLHRILVVAVESSALAEWGKCIRPINRNTTGLRKGCQTYFCML
jgi:hypothetical protein